jgi:hypothetical protein
MPIMVNKDLIDSASYFGVPHEWFTSLFVDVNSAYNTATIVFVHSAFEHQGHFRMLLRAMEEQGYKVRVYKPVPRTQGIISKLGYAPARLEQDVWIRGANVSRR